MKRFLLMCSLIAWPFTAPADQPAGQVDIHVEPSNLQGPRTLEKQTEKAVIRDYLQSWQAFGAAFEQNRADLLDTDFVGTAKDKLVGTIEAQAQAGIHTRYVDRSHDLQIVFYSPEGLSIELIDKVQYDVQIFDREKQQTTQHVNARYVVVMTPAEVRWRVRVFQAQPE